MAQSNQKSSVMVIGVSGGSGSGKTTFARMLQAHLGESHCAIVAQDNYYLDFKDQFDHDGGKVNFDHPSSIEFTLMTEHLKVLKGGQSVIVPQYDFATHSRISKAGNLLNPRPVIIVDGILILTQPDLVNELDFSFFVDTAEDLRYTRRLGRDVKERGRTPEGVFQQFYSQVKPMHDRFVEPCREVASHVISGEQSFGPVIDNFVYGISKSQQSDVLGQFAP